VVRSPSCTALATMSANNNERNERSTIEHRKTLKATMRDPRATQTVITYLTRESHNACATHTTYAHPVACPRGARRSSRVPAREPSCALEDSRLRQKQTYACRRLNRPFCSDRAKLCQPHILSQRFLLHDTCHMNLTVIGSHSVVCFSRAQNSGHSGPRE